ncbi:MAG TPA: N-methyl-L-tryptophan oxidase [Gemmatimonadales bacterium]|nr:N-methyl-L-tryptophan oxidase [Gemmatimonadales bacterium]
MTQYDVIVVGLGGMGSATLFHLARRGLRVLGLERYDLLHEYGSSHGLTRIIRLAYWEHPGYVALLRRSYQLWRELERLSGERLLYITGSIDGGPANGPVFSGALRSSEEHGLPFEVMDGAELNRRFPGYRLPPEIQCLYQPEGGVLLPERCNLAHVNAALAAGAQVRYREPVVEWGVNDRRCWVRTSRERYEAGRLVIAAGPWASKLVPELANLAVPERQVLAWLQPLRPERFTPDVFPVFYIELEEGRYYGFPSFLVPGFKFGRYHHRGEQVDPDRMNREPDPEDERLLRAFAERYFPDAAGPTLMLKTCLFTNSPDEHFILDRHPNHPEVMLAAGFSGHGYKFCSVVGEIMADLAEKGETRHDIGFLGLKRFTAATPAQRP